jgi:hypothetical protein
MAVEIRLSARGAELREAFRTHTYSAFFRLSSKGSLRTSGRCPYQQKGARPTSKSASATMGVNIGNVGSGGSDDILGETTHRTQ